MSSENIVKTQQEHDSLLQQVAPAVDNWSSAFWRLTVPNALMSQSTVTDITDESGNAISATLMYGERKGELKDIPYDHREVQGITDLTQESLWLYDNEKTSDIPTGFRKVKQPSFFIPTGKTNKCYKCSGRGQVKCWHCNGRGTVKREKDGRKYWEPCSWCSGGFVECKHCLGYGWVQHVINCATEYKTSVVQDVEYTGPVPKSAFAKVAGKVLFEETVDYPQDVLRSMLIGGIDVNEYTQLQGIVKGKLHQVIATRLSSYEGNIQLVHDVVDRFFNNIPNPVQSNKLLEYEIVPVRLRIKVERKPVYQVAYTYKSESYRLWVFGNEQKVYAPKKPREFTNKAAIFSVIVAIILIVVVVAGLLDPSLFGF